MQKAALATHCHIKSVWSQLVIKPSEQPKSAAISWSPQVLWSVLVALATVFGTGFAAGLKYQESQSSVTIAESKGSLAQSQAKLEVAQSRIEQLTNLLTQWQSAYQKLQSEVSQQQQTVASLTAQLGRSKNCTFIHEQIIATQRLIETPGGIMVFETGQEAREREQERTASLQRRLAGYQEQLSSCNK